MTNDKRIRVLLAKPGLDGHDQGAKVVVHALRDAGFDADVIALSSMAGSHLSFCRRLKPLLEQAKLGDKLWIIGGNLPAQDHDALRALGFRGIFPTGAKLDAICDYIRENAP